MVELSPKVDEAKAEKWAHALAPVLLEGEVIKAFACSRSLMTLDGIAFTNARVFTFYSGASEAKRIVDWVSAEKVRGLEIDSGWLRRELRIVADEGVKPFGFVAKSEIPFIQDQLDLVQRHGVDPSVSEALELFELEKAIEELDKEEFLQARDKVPVVGDPVSAAQWESIHSRSRDKELPWLILNNGRTGMMAAFDDRLVLFKSGMLASAASGSFTMGGGTTFRYDEIISIQHIGKTLDGTLEVVTPTYPSLTTSLEKGQKVDDERWKRPNCIPMPSFQYKVWMPQINEIGRKIAAARR